MSNKVKLMSVEEILSNSVLDYFIEPENCGFFLKKQDDFSEVANVVNSSKLDSVVEEVLNQSKQDFFTMQGVHVDKVRVNFGQSDNLATRKMAEKMREKYIGFSKKISNDKLLLFLSAITADFLGVVDRIKTGRISDGESREICYGNGDIITISGNEIFLKRDGISSVMTAEELQEQEDKMIEAILIANRQINGLSKNTKLAMSGLYKQTGANSDRVFISYSAKKLQEHSESPELLGRLSASKIAELLEKGLLSNNNLIKLFSKGSLDKNIALTLFADGKLKREDVLRIFKVQRENDILLNKDVSYESKLLLYSAGKIKIDLLEKTVKQYQEDTVDLTNCFKQIAKYYSNDIRRISELLTHNILDYKNSQRFLDVLEEEGQISPEDKKYLWQVMSDFKTNELLNNAENEVVLINSGNAPTYEKYRAGLTIDPEERKRYFQSIGAVKKVKIRGENFIKDNENNISKKNSLDGYELFIIPEKRVAILEKLYETTRDKKGNIEYKKTKQGKLVPAVENATYVIPIEMALEFAKKKNKKELIESPDVRRVSHTMEWVCNLESKIKSLMSVRGIEVDFEQENTRIWSDRIRKNYFENKEKREIR